MITVITRVYETTGTANNVLDKLKAAGFPERYLHVIDKDKGAAEAMEAAKVAPGAAAKYAPLVAKGNVLVVVEAPFTPVGAARRAMEIMDSEPAVDAGVENEARTVEPDIIYPSPSSILPDHPRFLTPKEFNPKNRPVTAMLGFRTLKPHKSKLSVSRNPRRMTGTVSSLVRRKPRKIKVRHNAQPITGRLFPLLTSHRKDLSASASIGTIFSDLFGIPGLIRR